MNRVVAILGSALVLATCSSPPSPAPRPAPGVQSLAIRGDYTHAKSGFVFPETFGTFERVGVSQFDAEGSDIGVGYDLDDGSVLIALTLYVYPPARTTSGDLVQLSEQFDLEKAAVSQAHGGATSSAAWTPPRTQNDESNPGHGIAFRYTEQFGGARQTVESLLYLFEYEGWLVKYRISYPASQAEAANLIAQIFVSGFRWKGGA